MNAETLLLQRNSHPRLVAPAPTEEQMTFIYNSALRAPDHGNLRPWQIIEFTGEGLNRLGTLYQQGLITRQPDADDAFLNKVKSMPLRAPMVLAVIAKVTPEHKVPVIEQIISAGAFAQNIILAAHAQGLGAMWRTGDVAFDPVVAKGLGLEPQDQIVGFIYLGQIEGRTKPIPEHNLNDFVQRWS